MWVYTINSDVLKHHGIKGQKWGIRRYQRKDGSLTNLGKKRVQQRLKERSVNNDIGTLYEKKKGDYLNEQYSLYEKKHPNLKYSYRYGKSDWMYNIMDVDAYSKKLDEFAQDYVNERSTKTLNDLGLQVTEQSKAYVKDLVEKESGTKEVRDDKRIESRIINEEKDPRKSKDEIERDIDTLASDIDIYREVHYGTVGDWISKSEAEKRLKREW